MNTYLDPKHVGAAALQDQAFAELCRLLELKDMELAPDAVWLSGQAAVYRLLREIGALTLAHPLAASVLCHECGSDAFRPAANPDGDVAQYPYRGYCPECGWVLLRAEQARPWTAQPAKIARWLGAALRLHVPIQTIIEGNLWRLGEFEHQRKRRTVFFGRRLDLLVDSVRERLDALCAPGAEVLITTTEAGMLRDTALRDRRLVPLRAIAHLRKAGFVVENLDAYLSGSDRVGTSNETSLRLMHTRRAVLILGQEYKISPQIYAILSVLEDAEGDEVHKRHIARALGIETVRMADVFKHHKHVFATFVDTDRKGNYWLKSEFLILKST